MPYEYGDDEYYLLPAGTEVVTHAHFSVPPLQARTKKSAAQLFFENAAPASSLPVKEYHLTVKQIGTWRGAICPECGTEFRVERRK